MPTCETFGSSFAANFPCPAGTADVVFHIGGGSGMQLSYISRNGSAACLDNLGVNNASPTALACPPAFQANWGTDPVDGSPFVAVE